jgi:SAM-dependent methyltransferase
MSRLDDPALVAEQYDREDGLRARQALYEETAGPDPKEALWQALVEWRPRKVLEVGGGPGELSERMQRELGATVTFVDISPRMVELARERGVDAQVGDVQSLPFPDGAFDTVVAAWMLYHVPDLERGLGELARVLQAGGRLVAVTNASEHLRQLKELLEVEPDSPSFWGHNGEAVLRRHFVTVERRVAFGWVSFPDRAAAQAFVDASMVVFRGRQLPLFSGPLRVRRASVVFIAEKA